MRAARTVMRRARQQRLPHAVLALMLLPLLLLACVTARCGPPAYCVCHSPDKVSCEGLPPAGDPAGPLLWGRSCASPRLVRDLSVQRGLVPELSERALRGLRLEALSVRASGLHAVHRRALAHQPQLRFLLLADNSLRALHRDAFASAPRLGRLYLDGNLLTDTAALRNLSAVQVLGLRSNALQALGADAFCCNHLSLLDVSDNELSSVDSNAFQKVPNLEELNLSENDIVSLPRNVFVNNTMLFDLKLSRNRISRLEFLWNIPSLRFLQLSHNALDSLPPNGFWGVPNLYHISLAHNRLTHVSQASLRHLERLADLDLSYNALTSVAADAFEGAPLLERLNVEGNQLTQLRFLAWSNAPALTHLLAARNAFASLDLCDHYSEGEEAVAPSLQELDLSDNPLQHVTACAFSMWPALASLRMRDTALDNESARVVVTYAPPNLLHIDLGGNALSEVPVRNTAQLRHLTLRANAITELPEDTFQNLTHDHLTLDLAENGMQSIHPLAFAGLEEVGALNLSCNDINQLDDNVFEKIASLWVLDLSYNSIEELNFLQNISSLRLLNVSHNNIRVIQDDAFCGLAIPLLFYLDLSANNISKVERYAFKGLLNLWDLNLSQNFISSFEYDTFHDATSLWDLNLSENKISNLEWLCISSLRHLNLSHNMVTEIPEELFSKNNTTLLTSLDLSHNLLRSLKNNVFSNLSYLEHLDISWNILEEVPDAALSPATTLVFLDLSGNRLRVAPTLPSLPALQFYDLSDNELVDLSTNATVGPSNLQELRVARNHLVSLDASTWGVNLPSLRNMDISGNAIAFIDPNVLNECPNLRSVDLSNNRLKQFPELHLPILRRLSLAANEMHELSNDALSGVYMPALAALDISHNQLGDLGAYTLRPLRQLRTLDLSHNEIKELHEDTFSGNTMLLALDISNNHITQLDMLRGLSELRMLNVSANKLQSFISVAARRSRAGRGYPRLEVIDVSHNMLQQLRARDLSSVPRLREIDVSFNRLQRVPAAMRSDARRLGTLRLHGNPWSREAAATLASEILQHQLLERGSNAHRIFDTLSAIDIEL